MLQHSEKTRKGHVPVQYRYYPDIFKDIQYGTQQHLVNAANVAGINPEKYAVVMPKFFFWNTEPFWSTVLKIGSLLNVQPVEVDDSAGDNDGDAPFHLFEIMFNALHHTHLHSIATFSIELYYWWRWPLSAALILFISLNLPCGVCGLFHFNLTRLCWYILDSLDSFELNQGVNETQFSPKSEQSS